MSKKRQQGGSVVMDRKKCRQKITSFLVTMAMVITCISPLGATAAEPSYAQDAETTVKAGKAVYTDMGLISGYDSTDGYDFIWMGEYKKEGETAKVPLKWRVLDDQTNTKQPGYFLLSDGSIETIYFERTGDQVDRGGYTEYIYSTLWEQSDARMWCRDFAGTTTGGYKWGNTPSAFTALEQAAILPTSKSDGAYTSKYRNDIGLTYEEIFMEYNNILNNDKVFLPSAEELYNEAYGLKYNVAVYTYLRSYPLRYDDKDLKVGKMGYDQIFVVNAFSETFEGELSWRMEYEYANDNAVTPALNLATDKALFTTAADNSGQVNFGLAKDYSGSEWKLTLKDNNSFASGAAVSGNKTTVKAGDSLTVNHKTLSSFDAGYTNVTAALVDEAGNVCAYGSVNNNTSATSSTFTIPENCEYGTYTLMISGEDWNAEHYTNYATGTPFTTTIQVTSPVELSGTIDITGTPEVGNTLNASVAGSNVDDDTLIYNWYREGSTDSLGTGKTYELTADDYNKNIICKVTSSKYSGEISKTVGLVAQGTPDIGTVTANELSDTLDVSQVALSRTDTSIPGELELTDNVLQYGTNTYNWKFTPENQAYKAITGTVSITVNDTIAPTAKYQVNDSQWREFVNFVSFGIFCKDTAVLKVDAADVTLAEKEHVYTIATTGNEADLTTNIPADSGETTYAVKESASNLKTYITNVQVDNNGKLTYDTAKATAPVDGLYITVTVTSENYNDFTVKLPIKLSDKQAVEITLPSAQNGTYNNGPHTGYTGAPAVEGHDVDFDITYEGVDGTEYSATTEKPVNAGDYKVTFTVKDDSVQGSASLEFSIFKGTPALKNVEADTLENTTDLNEIKVTYQTQNWSEGNLTIDNNQTLAYGNNSLDYTFTPNDTQNLNNASGKVNVLVKDTISPTAVISAANKEWKEFLNSITFILTPKSWT